MMRRLMDVEATVAFFVNNSTQHHMKRNTTMWTLRPQRKVWNRNIRLMTRMAIVLSLLVTTVSSAFLCRSTSFRKRSLSQQYRQGRGQRRMSFEGEQQQTLEVIQSLVEFHEGTWSGQATSFSVTPDVAAGIVQRKTSIPYQTSIKIGTQNKVNSKLDFGFTETFAWEDKISSRQVSFVNSNFDVDSVDASYSFDFTWPDLPSALTGTDKLTSFGIEHCLATSEEERVRCLVFYGVDQSLARIVVLDERRVRTTGAASNRWTASDLQQDVDRIVDKIAERVYTGNATGPVMPMVERKEEAVSSLTSAPQSSSTQSFPTLTRHTINLMELTSGLWLGDSVIRDFPRIAMMPPTNGRGFGENSMSSSQDDNYKNTWPAWSMGVQKVARQWWWDFGETVRQATDAGKALGAELVIATTSTAALQQTGFVCVNESLKRRIPKDQRMMYMDWNGGTYVGFFLGSVSIQVPRYLNFDSSAARPPKLFFTDFCVFQHSDVWPSSDTAKVDGKVPESGEVCCSQMSRVYNYEGRLRQAITSFFTLKRFDGQLDSDKGS